MREMLIGSVRQGPIPQHVAFVMDGNRRFARSHKIETVEGHNLGFEALAKVCSCCVISDKHSSNRMTTDLGGVLQMWGQGGYNLRIQH